jgi:5-methyltetrahydrofolate--homocysteine methyltransferase
MEALMSAFLQRLNQPGILIADGATGTMMQKMGLPRGTAPERWNLENPEAVRALHKSYIDAGSDVILTNTFGGTRYRLEREKLGDRVREINLLAAEQARAAATEAASSGRKVWVLGDIGPLGKLIKPLGPLTYQEAEAAFMEQAAGLLEGGIDAILIETMSDLNEVRAAVEGSRKAISAKPELDIPIMATMSFDTRGRTMMGVRPEEAANALQSLKVAVIGANCGRTLSETYEAVSAMHKVSPGMPLLAKPNAGLPRREVEAGKNANAVYDVDPLTMAEWAMKFNELGVKIFGGCCGSTPEHIRAASQALTSKD